MQAPHELLDPARMAEIDFAVGRLHDELGFDRPPFPFRDFLQRHRAYRVFEVSMPRGTDGRMVLETDSGCRVVHLRRENARTRIRFTLAHEILHAELHAREGKLPGTTACRTWNRLVDQSRQREELEADYGAAQLLMPLPMLEGHLDGIDPADPDRFALRRLARLFRVSDSAMRTQLSYLALCRPTRLSA